MKTPRLMEKMEPENTTWINNLPRRITVIENSTNEKTSVYIDDEINCERLSENDSCTVNSCCWRDCNNQQEPSK